MEAGYDESSTHGNQSLDNQEPIQQEEIINSDRIYHQSHPQHQIPNPTKVDRPMEIPAAKVCNFHIKFYRAYVLIAYVNVGLKDNRLFSFSRIVQSLRCVWLTVVLFALRPFYDNSSYRFIIIYVVYKFQVLSHLCTNICHLSKYYIFINSRNIVTLSF